MLAVSDSLHIGQHADAAVFSIMRDVSSMPKVHAAHDRLARLGVRVLGAVVTGTPLEHYDSKYYSPLPTRRQAASV